MKTLGRLINAQQAKAWLDALYIDLKPLLLAGHIFVVTIKTDSRTLAQNAMLWSILRDLARQVEWVVNGRLQFIGEEDWKNILTAGLTKEQRVAEGIDGGFVLLGSRTSEMSSKEMSDLIEFAYAFGSPRGVRWSRTSLGRHVPDEVIG